MSNEDDSDIEEIPPPKVRKVTEGSGGPCRRDDDHEVQEVIKRAQDIYECMLITINAFPSNAQQEQGITEAWTKACEMQDIQLSLTAEIFKQVCLYSIN